MPIDEEQCRVLESRLVSILSLLLKYGVQCNVSSGELLTYLQSPTYESNAVKLEEILNNELLLLHEVAEICFLKRMGHTISRDIIINAYPDTYYAHLTAMDIELAEAERQGKQDWITRRCKDLEGYLNDPYLPTSLEALVYKLINKYCNENIE